MKKQRNEKKKQRNEFQIERRKKKKEKKYKKETNATLKRVSKQIKSRIQLFNFCSGLKKKSWLLKQKAKASPKFRTRKSEKSAKKARKKREKTSKDSGGLFFKPSDSAPAIVVLCHYCSSPLAMIWLDKVRLLPKQLLVQEDFPAENDD